MISLELLAPAKDKETAIGAILAGCDALFIGGPAFGARFDAANSLADLKEICSFAHRFKVKVHLTLNTLLYDKELNSAQELIYKAADCGIDAIIFQDPAVLQLKIPQGIELHASTQCDIATREKLKFFENLNISQAVLPRELSLSDIKSFHEYCPNIRLEAFVAGALCVGQSGICYISEYMTGRSANRGQCAHICRLPMDLLSPDKKVIAHGHLLSMKDNYLGADLKSLIDAGVSSFKVEGRLKDRDYVVNMTAMMRKLLDKIIVASDGKLCRSSVGSLSCNFIPDEKRTFNRGFTNHYLQGNNDDLVNIKTPKFEGFPVGKITSVKKSGKNSEIVIEPFKGVSIENGDGFTYFKNNELTGFRCNKSFNSQGKISLEVLGHLDIPKHTLLKRNIDNGFIKAINAKNSVLRQMDLKAFVSLEKIDTDNLRLSLTYEDEILRYGKATLDFVYIQDAKGIKEETLIDKLKKSADIYLSVSDVDFNNVDLSLLTVPISAINELRRQAQNDYLIKLERVNSNFKFTLPDSLPSYPEAVDDRLILNKLAASFYLQVQNHDFKLKNIVKQSVISCRNCLIRNHAVCSKDGGKTTGYTLVIGKHHFKIFCDCVACKMHLIAQ